jgi:hypothetical protein
VLGASNMYSTAEACLLAWMSHHMAKAFPNLVSKVWCLEHHAALIAGAAASHTPGYTVSLTKNLIPEATLRSCVCAAPAGNASDQFRGQPAQWPGAGGAAGCTLAR